MTEEMKLTLRHAAERRKGLEEGMVLTSRSLVCGCSATFPYGSKACPGCGISADLAHPLYDTPELP